MTSWTTLKKDTYLSLSKFSHLTLKNNRVLIFSGNNKKPSPFFSLFTNSRPGKITLDNLFLKILTISSFASKHYD